MSACLCCLAHLVVLSVRGCMPLVNAITSDNIKISTKTLHRLLLFPQTVWWTDRSNAHGVTSQLVMLCVTVGTLWQHGQSCWSHRRPATCSPLPSKLMRLHSARNQMQQYVSACNHATSQYLMLFAPEPPLVCIPKMWCRLQIWCKIIL